MKTTKAQAEYRRGSGMRVCANCTMFRPPAGCTAVEGEISPKGYCKFFKRRQQLRVKA